MYLWVCEVLKYGNVGEQLHKAVSAASSAVCMLSVGRACSPWWFARTPYIVILDTMQWPTELVPRT